MTDLCTRNIWELGHKPSPAGSSSNASAMQSKDGPEWDRRSLKAQWQPFIVAGRDDSVIYSMGVAQLKHPLSGSEFKNLFELDACTEIGSTLPAEEIRCIWYKELVTVENSKFGSSETSQESQTLSIPLCDLHPYPLSSYPIKQHSQLLGPGQNPLWRFSVS